MLGRKVECFSIRVCFVLRIFILGELAGKFRLSVCQPVHAFWRPAGKPFATSALNFPDVLTRQADACFCTFQGCRVHVARAARHLRNRDFLGLRVTCCDAGASSFVKRWTLCVVTCFLWHRGCGSHMAPARDIETIS